MVAWKGPFSLSSMSVILLFGSVQGIEHGGRAAVWKDGHWPCSCSHKAYTVILKFEMLLQQLVVHKRKSPTQNVPEGEQFYDFS